MTKLKIRFMMAVLRFISDWYEENGMSSCDNCDDVRFMVDELEDKLEEE